MQVNEVATASKSQRCLPVDHPLLNKVRSCSTQPEQAAEFFAMLLWPWETRHTAKTAQTAPYIRALHDQLVQHRREAHLKTSMPILLIVSPQWPSPLPCPLPFPLSLSFPLPLAPAPCPLPPALVSLLHQHPVVSLSAVSQHKHHTICCHQRAFLPSYGACMAALQVMLHLQQTLASSAAHPGLMSNPLQPMQPPHPTTRLPTFSVSHLQPQLR